MMTQSPPPTTSNSAVRPVVLILGPTAGGKTALAIALAQRLPGGGEIVGADSMQVYRGMDIGTAKPTAEERRQAPHHLIDIVDPREPFTVDDWRTRASTTIAEIQARRRWPIVVGGTNLYLRVLLEGMFDGPPADEAFRATLQEVASTELQRRLALVDPAAAERIHGNDRKRLTRALEVYQVTGRPLTEWQSQWDKSGVMSNALCPDSILIGLDWPAERINPRINARVKIMMEEGFLDEVRQLRAAEALGRQARAALGYQQLLAHLEGSLTLEAAVERIKIETRRFARKQRTWLRRFRSHPRSSWLPIDDYDPEVIAVQSLSYIAAQPTIPVAD